jgi:hypothetical protein
VFVTTSKAPHKVLCGPVAESPHRQRRIDSGAGWKNSSAEDIQSGRVVDAQIAVHHRRGRVFAHAASAEVVAAHDATKAQVRTPISIAPGLFTSVGKRRSKTAAAVLASYGVKTNRVDVCLSIYLSGSSDRLGMDLCRCAEAI